MLNRREATKEEIEEIELLVKRYNCKIEIKKIDVKDKYELENYINNELRDEKSKVKGIFHLAGVIDDATLLKIDNEKIKKVLIPKIIGSWNLHILSKKYFPNLVIFNLFSSAAAFIGNAGQVNHAIANSFLDALSEIRVLENLPVNSINWGTWEKAGHLAQANNTMNKLTNKGFLGISPQIGISALETVLANNISQIAVLPMDWNRFIKYYGFEKNNLYEDFQMNDRENEFKEESNNIEKNEIKDIPLYIKNIVEEIIGIEIEDEEDSLIKLGLDSLSSIEIRNKMQNDLNIQLDANFIYKNPNLKSIKQVIENKLKEKNKLIMFKDNMQPSFQERRWLKLIEKKYGERVIPIIYELPFNKEFFRKSLEKVLERHISLRWYFPQGKIKELEIDEIIKSNEPIIYDLAKKSKIDKINEISKMIKNMFETMPSPYNRSSWIIKVINLDKDKFAILLGVQHIDFDGSSVSTFSREFKEFYCNMMFNEKINIEDNVVGYDEYIQWQDDYIKKDIKADREFFKGLYGNGKITLLPDINKNELGIPRIAKKITIKKDKIFISKIDKISQKYNVSRFSVILAAYAKLVSYITKNDLITIATIINGRSNTRFKNTIGPFSAPFPLKLYTGLGISNKELIEQCNNEIIEINTRSYYPVSDLINIVPEYNDLPIETYFSDIGINYTNYKPKNEKNQNDRYKVIEILTKVKEEEFQIFNEITFKRIPGLHLVINELKEDLAFNFYYQIERIDEKTINQWIDKFFNELENIIN